MRDKMDNLKFFMGLVRLGYFSIDSDGNIWRMLKRNKHGGYTEMRKKNASISEGYLYVNFVYYIGKEKKRQCITCKAQRIVYTYFKGEIPKGLTINHIDGKKKNNKPGNLELATPKYQIEHATYILGTRLYTEHRNPNAKMTEDDYKLLKELADEGKRPCEIAKYFTFMTYKGIETAVRRYRNRGEK